MIPTKKMLAWSVHIFTSLGLLAAFMAVVAIDQENWQMSFLWLLVCFLIDSLDGSLARLFNVEEVLPNMDGKMIDFVIDFTSYAFVPAFFFYKAKMVADDFMYPSLAIILLSAALYYGKKGMVEEEQYFVGFPVLWNFVIFYQFFIFHNNPLLNFISVICIGILHFVPIRFAYPSRAKRFLTSHILFSVVGFIGAFSVLWYFPQDRLWMQGAAVLAGVYFMMFAIYDTLKK